MQTLLITVLLIVMAHQAVGSLLKSDMVKTLEDRKTKIELAANGSAK